MNEPKIVEKNGVHFVERAKAPLTEKEEKALRVRREREAAGMFFRDGAALQKQGHTTPSMQGVDVKK